MTPGGDDDRSPPDPEIARKEEASTVPDENSPGVTSPRRIRETAVAVSVGWSGPLPPPELLRQYDEVVPGLANQIAEQARIEPGRLHELNEDALKAATEYGRRGQWMGFLVLMAILGVSVFAIKQGAWVVAGIALSGIVSAAGAFVFSALRKQGRAGR